MNSVWIALSIELVMIFVTLGMLIYAFYKIDQVKFKLNAQLNDLQRKFVRLIDAINAVNLSDYQLDTAQQNKIDELARKVM